MNNMTMNDMRNMPAEEYYRRKKIAEAEALKKQQHIAAIQAIKKNPKMMKEAASLYKNSYSSPEEAAMAQKDLSQYLGADVAPEDVAASNYISWQENAREMAARDKRESDYLDANPQVGLDYPDFPF